MSSIEYVNYVLEQISEGKWPKHLFVEVKTTEDVNAPIVQATEDVASYYDSAVIQIRIIWPGNPNSIPHPMVSAAKKLMGSLAVSYRDVRIG